MSYPFEVVVRTDDLAVLHMLRGSQLPLSKDGQRQEQDPCRNWRKRLAR